MNTTTMKEGGIVDLFLCTRHCARHRKMHSLILPSDKMVESHELLLTKNQISKLLEHHKQYQCCVQGGMGKQKKKNPCEAIWKEKELQNRI